MPVLRSVTRAVLSHDAVASSFPSGEKLTDNTLKSCTIMRRVLPVFRSVTRAVLSNDAVASSFPSGENLTDWT